MESSTGNGAGGEQFPFTYAPCQTYQVDISGKWIPSWLLLIIVIIIVIYLIWEEHSAHDCIPGKSCSQSVNRPTKDDNDVQYVDKIINMVNNNYDFVTWRLALIAGLIGAFPLIFYLKGRFPTLVEWLIATIIIFFFTYLSFSWIWAHFFHPNGCAIEENLLSLRDRIVDKSEDKEHNIIQNAYNL